MTSWASCSSWEPPRRPDSRRKPALPNRPGLPDTFCTARPYRKWAGLLVQNRYFWFKMDFWCKAGHGSRSPLAPDALVGMVVDDRAVVERHREGGEQAAALDGEAEAGA